MPTMPMLILSLAPSTRPREKAALAAMKVLRDEVDISICLPSSANRITGMRTDRSLTRQSRNQTSCVYDAEARRHGGRRGEERKQGQWSAMDPRHRRGARGESGDRGGTFSRPRLGLEWRQRG